MVPVSDEATALSRAATEARAAEPAKAPPPPQYSTGFEGAASAPFSPEAAALLAAPVVETEVEVRSDGIVYLPGVAYRRILTRAFGAGAWALLPRGPARTMGDLVVYHGALYILGRFVSEAMGECETRQGMSYASSLEGARTDCLTRCCKDLGIATELWDPAWRDGWLKKYTEREWVPPEGNRKGKWKYWLKDKAGTQALLTGRNVGAPAPEVVKAIQQVITDVATMGPDTGEAPDAETITAIRKAVKALTWKPSYARIWLDGAFGVTSVEALTAVQAADALQLLEACLADDTEVAYGEIRAKLVAAGRVKAS